MRSSKNRRLLGLFLIAGSTQALGKMRGFACARMREGCWSSAPELSVAVDLVLIAVAALVIFTIWANLVFRLLFGARGSGTTSAPTTEA